MTRPDVGLQAEEQLADLQQKYKELEERVQKEDTEKAASDQLDTAGLPELGSILEEDELPMGVVDRRGRSLGGAEGHASVKALKAQVTITNYLVPETDSKRTRSLFVFLVHIGRKVNGGSLSGNLERVPITILSALY